MNALKKTVLFLLAVSLSAGFALAEDFDLEDIWDEELVAERKRIRIHDDRGRFFRTASGCRTCRLRLSF